MNKQIWILPNLQTESIVKFSVCDDGGVGFKCAKKVAKMSQNVHVIFVQIHF